MLYSRHGTLPRPPLLPRPLPLVPLPQPPPPPPNASCSMAGVYDPNGASQRLLHTQPAHTGCPPALRVAGDLLRNPCTFNTASFLCGCRVLSCHAIIGIHGQEVSLQRCGPLSPMLISLDLRLSQTCNLVLHGSSVMCTSLTELHVHRARPVRLSSLKAFPEGQSAAQRTHREMGPTPALQRPTDNPYDAGQNPARLLRARFYE